MILTTLPCELVLQVASYVPNRDLKALRLTCHEFQHLVTPLLFRRFVYHHMKGPLGFRFSRYDNNEEIGRPILEKVHEDMRTGSVTTGLLGDSFHDRMRELILRQEVRAVTMAKKDVSAVAGVLRENVRAAAIILHEVESDGDSESATQGLERILEILEHVTELKIKFDEKAPYSIPALHNFFDTRAKTLTHLTLARFRTCTTPYLTTLPQSLTHLTISLRYYTQANAPNLSQLLSRLPTTLHSLTLRTIKPDFYTHCVFIDSILPSSTFPNLRTLSLHNFYLTLDGATFAHQLHATFPHLHILTWNAPRAPRADFPGSAEFFDILFPRPREESQLDQNLELFWRSLISLDPPINLDSLATTRITPGLVSYIQHTRTGIKTLDLSHGDVAWTLDSAALFAAVTRHAETLESFTVPSDQCSPCPIFGPKAPPTGAEYPGNTRRFGEGSHYIDDIDISSSASAAPVWLPQLLTLRALKSLTLTCRPANIHTLFTYLSTSPHLSCSLELVKLRTPTRPRHPAGKFGRLGGDGITEEEAVTWREFTVQAVDGWVVPAKWKALREVWVENRVGWDMWGRWGGRLKGGWEEELGTWDQAAAWEAPV